eukprot:GHRQ01017306.1.p2 GENE.GHRQ01017306.1~~GHRQ01017306.1.p2  ORF type:complete len:112 (+),score=12.18 GHRQ01017306.1:31-336(+)
MVARNVLGVADQWAVTGESSSCCVSSSSSSITLPVQAIASVNSINSIGRAPHMSRRRWDHCSCYLFGWQSMIRLFVGPGVRPMVAQRVLMLASASQRCIIV